MKRGAGCVCPIRAGEQLVAVSGHGGESASLPAARPPPARAQFEPPVRNSGIVGGKFLERQRVYKPGSEEIYTHQVGARMDRSA